ncbi:CAP domain-containing protein [Streptomyces sp. NPDC052036]|uniref:CAP domain-containing protein n=1 Tax=unclassified Streptomyces TaxID=2593676 RepID=UPI00341C8293
MGKHRKDSRYRRIIMAAVAVGAVGAPSAALACVDWQGGGGKQTHTDAKASTPVSWSHPDRPHLLYGEVNVVPSATPSQTATGTKRTPKAAPKPKVSMRPRATHTAAPGQRTATAPVSSPKATATPTPTATATASAAAPTAPAATPTASGVTARVVELVNAERAKVGCSPLTVNATLTKVAQAHSDDMAAHQNMSHTGSDGSSPGDRITQAGYSWSTYGENVAYGYATPEQVMAGWMSSPGHKANILNCEFKEIGVGLAQPDSYWTQDFGTAQ